MNVNLTNQNGFLLIDSIITIASVTISYYCTNY